LYVLDILRICRGGKKCGYDEAAATGAPPAARHRRARTKRVRSLRTQHELLHIAIRRSFKERQAK
jgi:hypothetical protein